MSDDRVSESYLSSLENFGRCCRAMERLYLLLNTKELSCYEREKIIFSIKQIRKELEYYRRRLAGEWR